MVLSINEHHPKIKQTHYCLNHSRDSFFRFQNSSLQCYCPHYKSWLYNTGLTFRLTPWLTLLNLKRVKMLWKGLAEPSNRTFNAHRCFQVYEIWQYLLCCVQIQTQFQQHSASVVSREQFKWNWILNYSVKEAQDTLAPVTPQLLDLESWFTLNCSRKENEKKGCRDTSLSLTGFSLPSSRELWTFVGKEHRSTASRFAPTPSSQQPLKANTLLRASVESQRNAALRLLSHQPWQDPKPPMRGLLCVDFCWNSLLTLRRGATFKWTKNSKIFFDNSCETHPVKPRL